MKRFSLFATAALAAVASFSTLAAPANMDELRSKAMDQKLTNQQRMEAIRAMYLTLPLRWCRPPAEYSDPIQQDG